MSQVKVKNDTFFLASLLSCQTTELFLRKETSVTAPT